MRPLQSLSSDELEEVTGGFVSNLCTASPEERERIIRHQSGAGSLAFRRCLVQRYCEHRGERLGTSEAYRRAADQCGPLRNQHGVPQPPSQ